MFTRTPEKLAWATILTAQLICLMIATAGFISSRWFLFDSTAGLHTEVRVGRGTVGVRLASSGNEEAVRLNRKLEPRETVTVDPIAQGTLEFVDTSDNNRVVANATLFGDSRVRFVEATRPRFHLGDKPYTILLDNLVGRIEVQIPSSLPRHVDFEIRAESGSVSIRESGFYTISSTASTLTVFPRVGSATLMLPGGRADTISTGYTGTGNIFTETITSELITAEIFDNPFFFNALENAPTPEGWGCEQAVNTDHADYYLTTFEGRRSVYIKRLGQNLGPGATLCKQWLGINGANVIPYSSLHIRATLNVRGHSLSICGIKASECVLMLRMYYKNEYGQDLEWIHGFYSYNYNPGDSTPTQCDTCLIAHDQITPGNWFTYESPNLMNLPEGRRPTSITRIEFYASGHAYEVAVAEVSLIAER